MKHPVLSLHLVNRSTSEPRVCLDRRSANLKQGHYRTYALLSPLRLGRILSIIPSLPGASTAIYPQGYTILWQRNRLEPKQIYFFRD